MTDHDEHENIPASAAGPEVPSDWSGFAGRVRLHGPEGERDVSLAIWTLADDHVLLRMDSSADAEPTDLLLLGLRVLVSNTERDVWPATIIVPAEHAHALQEEFAARFEIAVADEIPAATTVVWLSQLADVGREFADSGWVAAPTGTQRKFLEAAAELYTSDLQQAQLSCVFELGDDDAWILGGRVLVGDDYRLFCFSPIAKVDSEVMVVGFEFVPGLGPIGHVWEHSGVIPLVYRCSFDEIGVPLVERDFERATLLCHALARTLEAKDRWRATWRHPSLGEVTTMRMTTVQPVSRAFILDMVAGLIGIGSTRQRAIQAGLAAIPDLGVEELVDAVLPKAERRRRAVWIEKATSVGIDAVALELDGLPTP